MDSWEIRPVAHYSGAFGSKFGLPRQSGLAPGIVGRVVFEAPYRVREALRGLEEFSRLWLIWGFSANKPAKGEWQPTVRPPRLGGNTALGLWATRSPFRPSGLGLSCVELLEVDGLDLVVRGADLMDGTPVFDIKPYIAYADSFPDARCGFAPEAPEAKLQVLIPESLPLTVQQRQVLTQVLALDPRPAYQDRPEKEYAMPFGGKDIRFRVRDGVVEVLSWGD